MPGHPASGGELPLKSLESPGSLSPELLRAIRNLSTWAGALPVLEELNRLDIPMIVLKSLPQVEELYGSAAGRQTSDIDLVIPGERALEALRAAQNLGWRLEYHARFEAISARRGPATTARCRPWHISTGTEARNFITIDLHTDSMDP